MFELMIVSKHPGLQISDQMVQSNLLMRSSFSSKFILGILFTFDGPYYEF